MTHIRVSKLTVIGSDNGLSPGQRQAIMWTNAGILLIQNMGTSFSQILSKIPTFPFKEMHLKISSAKLRQFWLGLSVLMQLLLNSEFDYIANYQTAPLLQHVCLTVFIVIT